jgi:hypothetical protein
LRWVLLFVPADFARYRMRVVGLQGVAASKNSRRRNGGESANTPNTGATTEAWDVPVFDRGLGV